MHQDILALLLPDELKYNIALFCIPSSLASLARVHTSYQLEAERVLYQNVCMCVWDPKGMSCMDTLSSNPEQASFVRSLTVEFASDWRKNLDEGYRVATTLPTALLHMKALSDLHIRLPNETSYRFLVREIVDTLRNKYFRLHTLYCNDYFDIVEIVKDQRQLQCLGIYASSPFDEITSKRVDGCLPSTLADSVSRRICGEQAFREAVE